MSDTVSVERQDALAIVRFDRGGQANAMSFDMMQDLTRAADRLQDEPDLAVIVLTGAPRIFSGGMDLKADAWDRLEGMSVEQRRRLASRGPRLARAWCGLEPITIAAIEGPCFAGGVALAAFCDFRVCAAGSRFAAPEVAIGLNMAWHSVPRLIRLIGLQPTRRLLLRGDSWTAREAEALGFIDVVADDGAVMDAAMTMARAMASRPAVAMQLVKRSIEIAAHAGDAQISAPDSDLQLINWQSQVFADARAALKARKR
ncbi:MAG: enoyl-CoA hydratase/isomerase family protein [Pseudomonadota bacterium]